MRDFERNLVVLLNLRSVLSLAGVLLVALYTWLWDRKWEQEGPDNGKAIALDKQPDPEEKGDDTEYKAMKEKGEEDQSDEGNKSDEDDKEGPTKKVVHDDASTVTWKELVAYPKDDGGNVPLVNSGAMVGWVLLALSCLFSRKKWFAFKITKLGLASLVIFLVLGYIQSVIIPKTIVRRKSSEKRDMLNTVMLSGWILVGVITFLSDRYSPFFAAPVGGLCIASSPIVLWYARKVGDTFDSEDRVNPKPVLYNFGGPLLVFGWFWFWIGFNTCFYEPGRWAPFVYLFVGRRMVLAFVGAIFIIFTTWLVGYGLDELDNVSGQPETSLLFQEASAFGMDGTFFGYVYEIKVAFIISWAVLGLAMFFPYIWEDYSDWIFLLAVVGMGFCMSSIQEEGMRMMDADKVEVWSKRAYGMLAVATIIIPIQQGGHYLNILLSAGGAAAFAFGMQHMFLDQKRGKKWLATGEVQEPNVFSWGAILTPFGALIFAWAVSMHPAQ